MHRVLAQQVDTEFLSSLRKTELTVESENIREDAPTLSVMNKLQEFLRKFHARRIKPTIERRAIKIVDPLMLVVQCSVKNASPKALRREHARDEGSELDITMVKLCWHRSRELYLNGLETDEQRESAHRFGDLRAGK